LTASDRQSRVRPFVELAVRERSTPENIEHRDRGSGINAAKFGGHGKRQDAHRRFRI
jgi:hypothetical protein